MVAGFEIDFIGHACLKIHVGELKILTDPWIEGPAYTRQWFLYPPPNRSLPLEDADYIHYSHGHEDHLHAGSFHLLLKRATVLFTRQWFPGNVEWLKSEGFENVVEIPSGRWTWLADRAGRKVARLVNLVNRSDSMSILATDSEVLVNVNDSLHCFDPECIDYYTRRIQSLLRGRPIDYLFCGFGGASYFPNCLRHTQKNDREVALAREWQLAEGFARVVGNLQPRLAFAFAAGLVLLEPFNRWINEVKFANDPVRVAEEQFSFMRGRVFKLLPGDRIAGGRLQRAQSDLAVEEHVRRYQAIYAEEIAAKDSRPQLSFDQASELLGRLETHIGERLKRIRARNLRFDWAIRLRDCPDAILRVTLRDGIFRASRPEGSDVGQAADMVVEANSDVLRAGLDSLWGGDSLQIGYGAIFHLKSDESVTANHSRLFLRLATRLPMQSDYLRMAPLRGLDHLLHSPYLMREAVRIATSRVHRNSVDSSAGRSDMMEARRWISVSKCAACPVCDVPEP